MNSEIQDITKAYVFRVTLDSPHHTKSRPKRELRMLGSRNLYDLAELIIDSFGFEFDHSFGFYSNLERWTQSEAGFELFADIGESSKFPGLKSTRIQDAFPGIAHAFALLFDYGDEWIFRVEVLDIVPASPDTLIPKVLKEEGKAPRQY